MSRPRPRRPARMGDRERYVAAAARARRPFDRHAPVADDPEHQQDPDDARESPNRIMPIRTDCTDTAPSSVPAGSRDCQARRRRGARRRRSRSPPSSARVLHARQARTHTPVTDDPQSDRIGAMRCPPGAGRLPVRPRSDVRRRPLRLPGAKRSTLSRPRFRAEHVTSQDPRPVAQARPKSTRAIRRPVQAIGRPDRAPRGGPRLVEPTSEIRFGRDLVGHGTGRADPDRR